MRKTNPKMWNKTKSLVASKKIVSSRKVDGRQSASHSPRGHEQDQMTQGTLSCNRAVINRVILNPLLAMYAK